MSKVFTCGNPDCGVQIKAANREVGDVLECPKCGHEGKVLAEFPEEFEIETVEPPEEGEPQHHPARQICSNCGALLGVRDAFCPHCNADIRTGTVVMQAPEVDTRPAWVLPVAIGAGAAVVVAAVIIVLLLMAG